MEANIEAKMSVRMLADMKRMVAVKIQIIFENTLNNQF